MTNSDDEKKFRQKWWLHPMDPENLPELSKTDRKNAKSFNTWILIWGAMYFGLLLGVDPIGADSANIPVWRLVIAASPLVSGVFLIRAFIRLMNQMKDELIKTIYYKAISVGFLFAFIIGMYFNLSAEIIGSSSKAGPFIFAGLLMGYFLGLTLNYKKYNA